MAGQFSEVVIRTGRGTETRHKVRDENVEAFKRERRAEFEQKNPGKVCPFSFRTEELIRRD